MKKTWIKLPGILLLSVLFNTHWLGAEEASRLASEPGRGFASPAEAWEGLCKAYEEQDWESVYDCLTPAARDEATFNALGSLIMSVEWHDLRKIDDQKIQALVAASDALLKTNGISLKQIENESSKAEKAGLGLLELQRNCLRPLTDKRRFYAKSTSLSIKIRNAFYARGATGGDRIRARCGRSAESWKTCRRQNSSRSSDRQCDESRA